MNDDIYDDFELAHLAHERFGLDIEISQVIVPQIPVSSTAQATVFLTKKKQLFVYIDAHSRLLLGDVKKIVARMGLRAEIYFPPKGRPDYFDTIAREKFHAVFPGRSHVIDSDLTFYRTLAPYKPAMVLISEVKDGEIYRFDSDSRTNWRVAAKFAYRRIKTS
jgi:hypothetical protein